MCQVGITSGIDSVARNRTRAIVACTDPRIRQLLINVLHELGLQPVGSETVGEIQALLAEGDTAMVLSQPRFTVGSFREVLRAAARPGSSVPVIVCSDFYDKDLYVEAMTLGAFDYLALPYRYEDVAWVLTNALTGGSLSQTFSGTRVGAE